MSWYTPQWIYRIHHIPSGEVVETNANFYRTMVAGRKVLLSQLKARLYAKDHDILRSRNVVASYVYHDEEPDDLMEIRRMK